MGRCPVSQALLRLVVDFRWRSHFSGPITHINMYHAIPKDYYSSLIILYIMICEPLTLQIVDLGQGWEQSLRSHSYKSSHVLLHAVLQRWYPQWGFTLKDMTRHNATLLEVHEYGVYCKQTLFLWLRLQNYIHSHWTQQLHQHRHTEAVVDFRWHYLYLPQLQIQTWIRLYHRHYHCKSRIRAGLRAEQYDQLGQDL